MKQHQWVAGLAALLLLAGCGDEASGDAANEPLVPPSLAPASALPEVSDGAALELPLAAYRHSAEQATVISRAEGLIIQQCMRRLGFATWQPPAPARQGRLWTSGLDLGIVDMEQATRYGYHSPESIAADAERRGGATRKADHAELAALTGDDEFGVPPGKDVPAGGCSGEAARKLREGGPDADVELDGRLSEQAGKATAADERVVTVVAAWSECMAAAGHRYRTPAEAAGQEWAPTPTAAERAIATADVRCKEQTRLPQIWFGVQAGYENQLIARNREALDEVRAQVENEVERAGQVLANGA
ncbi:hypothetical protein [Actinoplanes sp. NPDC049802]|uniref:hypothetical protein n=1 Tax=Actinoplanes sp. NPDC049802 TaxID=3154742 RepID=UPI0033EE47B5